jgi:hypothetical protein
MNFSESPNRFQERLGITMTNNAENDKLKKKMKIIFYPEVKTTYRKRTAK